MLVNIIRSELLSVGSMRKAVRGRELLTRGAALVGAADIYSHYIERDSQGGEMAIAQESQDLYLRNCVSSNCSAASSGVACQIASHRASAIAIPEDRLSPR